MEGGRLSGSMEMRIYYLEAEEKSIFPVGRWMVNVIWMQGRYIGWCACLRASERRVGGVVGLTMGLCLGWLWQHVISCMLFFGLIAGWVICKLA